MLSSSCTVFFPGDKSEYAPYSVYWQDLSLHFHQCCICYRDIALCTHHKQGISLKWVSQSLHDVRKKGVLLTIHNKEISPTDKNRANSWLIQHVLINKNYKTDPFGISNAFYQHIIVRLESNRWPLCSDIDNAKRNMDD